jgi:hypothetical protein
MDYAMVHDMLARVPTFESRVKIVRTLVERWATPGPEADSVLEGVGKLSALSKTRNRLVHGHWVSTLERDLTVVFDFRELRGTPRHRRTVKAHDVAAHVNAVQERTIQLAKICLSLQPISP